MALSPKVAQAFMSRYGSLPPELGSTYVPQATGLSEAADPIRLSESLKGMVSSAKDAAGNLSKKGDAEEEAPEGKSRAMQNAAKMEVDFSKQQAPTLQQAYAPVQAPKVDLNAAPSLQQAYAPPDLVYDPEFSKRVAMHIPSLTGGTGG